MFCLTVQPASKLQQAFQQCNRLRCGHQKLLMLLPKASDRWCFQARRLRPVPGWRQGRQLCLIVPRNGLDCSQKWPLRHYSEYVHPLPVGKAEKKLREARVYLPIMGRFSRHVGHLKTNLFAAACSPNALDEGRYCILTWGICRNNLIRSCDSRYCSTDPDSGPVIGMQLSSVFCQRRPATPGSTRLRHRQHSLAGRTQQRSVVVRAEGPKDVYVLDDGVIVNSTLRKTHKGINNALKQCQSPWYVSSAHSAEQTAPLLTELTGNDFPEDSPRLLAGLDPPEDKLPEALR